MMMIEINPLFLHIRSAMKRKKDEEKMLMMMLVMMSGDDDDEGSDTMRKFRLQKLES